MDRSRLGVCRIYRFARFGKCRFGSERAFYVVDVVVDSLGNADDRDLEIPLFDLVDERNCTALRAVTAYRVEDVYSELVKSVDHFFGILVSSARSDECAALKLLVFDHRRSQVLDLIA